MVHKLGSGFQLFLLSLAHRIEKRHRELRELADDATARGRPPIGILAIHGLAHALGLAGDVVGAGACAVADPLDPDADLDTLRGRIGDDLAIRIDVLSEQVAELRTAPLSACFKFFNRLELESEAARLRALRAMLPYLTRDGLLHLFGAVGIGDGRLDYLRQCRVDRPPGRDDRDGDDDNADDDDEPGVV